MLDNVKTTESCFVFDSSNAVFLKTLTDNGIATLHEDGSVEVPFENIYELNDFEREIVGLPPLYPFEILISHQGIPFTPAFTYEVSFKSFAPCGDELPKKEQKGPVVSLIVKGETNDYLLTLEQFRLVKALAEFNGLQTKSKLESYKCFAEIKELSKESASVLDETLNNRNVVLPKNIRLDVSFNNGELEITPSIDDESSDEFVKKIDSGSEVQDHYPMAKGLQKTIVVLDLPVQDSLKKVKQKRKIKDPEEIKAIIEHPEEFFDPEVTDLSVFYSDRVIGKGLYEPKVYPFISPYKSQWIPSFEVEDRTNGTTRISIKDATELAEFSEIIATAKREKKPYCEYKGANISIDEAEKMEKFAKEQLRKKEAVTATGPNSIEEKKSKHEVLLIEENLEETGYDVSREVNYLPKQLALEENPYLEKEFSLKDHQVEGIAWLQNLAKNAKGGLLADDMGLGKTLQVLYMLDWHSRFKNNSNKPYLIVAPVSLLENWVREYKRFFKEGMPIEIAEHIPKENKEFVSDHSHKHIMVVGYEAMRRGQFSLAAIDFAVIVLDEAQKIKAPGAMVTNAAKALKSDLRISMTGTPVENTYMDLWCIMDFAVPGLLGNAKEFARKYQDPLKDSETDIEMLGNNLRHELGGYFLRRIKADVSKDLPQKHVEYHKVPMPLEQYNRYVSAINLGRQTQAHPFERILGLRKISDHPYLDFKDIEHISVDDLIRSSAKMSATMQILEDIRNKNEKVIVFTDRRDMQRMLQRIILQKFGIEASVINGDTSTSDKGNKVSRQRTVDIFQEKPGFNVIIMSQLAAGVGLNVVGANHVVHYSRHWNPAKEMQATDRVYRIGQTKDVYVHFPMAVCDSFDSFDVVLDNLLQNKTHLATASLYPTDRIEVVQKELDGKLFGTAMADEKTYVAIEELEDMDEYLFEAFVAVYYASLGYKTSVTPRSGDKGVDVLAFGSLENLAIQCKHSRGRVGVEALGEIAVGVNVYKEKYSGKEFKPVVFTNNAFSLEAKDRAKSNNIALVDGDVIRRTFKSNTYQWNDVWLADANRK